MKRGCLVELERAVQPSRAPAVLEPALWRKPVYQAFRVLRFGFTVAPVLAGLDKYFNLLVHWEQYLTPLVPRMTGISPHGFMLIVGPVEIIAGIGVALRPKVFGYVVAAWLWGIVLNLLLVPGYYDVALRDFGLSLGALALARLATCFDRSAA